MASTKKMMAGFCAAAVAIVVVYESNAQVSRTLPWSDGDLTQTGRCSVAYHPEPIIFVHGITAARVKWEAVISHLHSQSWHQPYHYISDNFLGAKESTSVTNEGYADTDFGATFIPASEKNQWRDIEEPYLHTFNYGRHARVGPAPDYVTPTMVRQSRQTHDPVEWNSWEAPDDDYLDGRVTLRDRIEDENQGVRAAYQMPGQLPPNVILIGHSLGGLVVCDYLLKKNSDLQGDPYVPVRRAVTVNSLLWGSPIANLLVNWRNLPRAGHGGMAWANWLGAVIGPISGNAAGTWIENHDGASRYFAINLQESIDKGDIPEPSTTGVLTNESPFQAYLHSTPMPTTTEFITSGSQGKGAGFLVKAVIGTRSMLMTDLQEAFNGDQAVPLYSMAGYHRDGSSVFTNIAPVDIRGYLIDTNVYPNATNWFSSHGPATDQMGIYPHLLDGIQYITGPRPERPGNWSGLQKQYTNSPSQGAS